MSKSRFKSKVSAAAVKYMPDGIHLHFKRENAKWVATATSESVLTDAVSANGLMDCANKVCKAWHQKAGTNLVAHVRAAEKAERKEVQP